MFGEKVLFLLFNYNHIANVVLLWRSTYELRTDDIGSILLLKNALLGDLFETWIAQIFFKPNKLTILFKFNLLG